MVLFAAVALFVWLPGDIRGGFLENDTSGRVQPGDAFFPMLLAGLILLLSLGSLASSWFGSAAQGELGRITTANVQFLVRLAIVLGVGLVVMMWLGPAAVELLNRFADADTSYRALSDTVPFKYIGYVAGGLFITLSLIRLAAGKVTLRAAISVLVVMLVLIGILDGLLSNVQLPPNADV